MEVETIQEPEEPDDLEMSRNLENSKIMKVGDVSFRKMDESFHNAEI